MSFIRDGLHPTSLYQRRVAVTLTAPKTAIIISHRFSTVCTADRIVVLDAGEIVEAGAHAELIVAGGRYAERLELQAAGYR